MEKISYKGWENCYRLANRQVDLVITGDVGPRIIRFGFVGQHNEFKEFEEMMGQTGGDEWRIYGGHRLWHAPEEKPRSYIPDNSPIEVKETGGTVHIVQPVEAATGIQKEIDICLDPDQPKVELVHRLINRNLWAVELAPWALSVMAPGGVAILPIPPRGSHETNLLPSHTMTFWAYTDMADPRWTWGRRCILLRQEVNCPGPQRIGLMVPQGWAAYARLNHLFVKKFTFFPGETYPDAGCSVESFTNSDFLEVETVGPMIKLQPGQAVEHGETWQLFDQAPAPQNEADVLGKIFPLIEG